MPDTALLIVGGGPGLETLREKTVLENVQDSIFFTDYVPREDSNYYLLADIFVFPSLTETQGLGTIEAMMTGLPVVAIGEMGTLDVMQGNNGGFMVSNNVDEFSGSVLKLLNDKELYKLKAEEAKAWSQKWDITHLTHKLVTLYQKAQQFQNVNS